MSIKQVNSADIASDLPNSTYELDVILAEKLDADDSKRFKSWIKEVYGENLIIQFKLQ